VTAVVERTELLVPAPAEALANLLEVELPDLEGAGLPLLWHWFYLLERPRQADLGEDGHPRRNGIPAPPGPGMRRMWAGGSTRALGPLRCGEPATRRSTVVSTQEKSGRSGSLTFVTVGQQIFQRGELVVDERQDIVYLPTRPQPQGDAAEQRTEAPGAASAGAGSWTIDVTPSLLFRFSALTYNAHRIHYDHDYSRQVEGYPGLLTHGPLQILAMSESARADGKLKGDLLSCEYRLLAPLFAHQGLTARIGYEGEAAQATVTDLTGRQTARATITATNIDKERG
jgi:3-methylfumaryl-CoA hydratase